MSIERLKERMEDYHKAVTRLKEALDEDFSNPLVYDGVIQRFEFCYELAWKLMKAYLEYEGRTPANSPRASFKEAFAAGLIVDGDVWIEMIDAHNLTVHTYNELIAQEIYTKVKEKYYWAFKALAERMEERLK